MDYRSVWGKKFYARDGIFALVTILLLATVTLPLGCVQTSRSNSEAADEISEGSSVKAVDDGTGYIKKRLLINLQLIETNEDFLNKFGINPKTAESDDLLFDSSRLEFILNAMKESGDGRVLAAPTLLVRDSETATQKTKKDIAYVSGYEEDPNKPGRFNKISRHVDDGFIMELVPNIFKDSLNIDIAIRRNQLIKFNTKKDEAGRKIEEPQEAMAESITQIVMPYEKTYVIKIPGSGVLESKCNELPKTNYNKDLIVLMTPKIIEHKEISDEALKALIERVEKSRAKTGEKIKPQKQFLIETWFIRVDENFLEDIGLNFNGAGIMSNNRNVHVEKIKKAILEPEVSYEFFEGSKPMEDKKAAEILRYMGVNDSDDIGVGYIDHKVLDFLLRAGNAYKDARISAAPEFLIMDNDPGVISVIKENKYISGYKEVSGVDGKSFEPVNKSFKTGIEFEVLPKILEESGNIDLSFESVMKDDILNRPQKHQSGKMYDIVELQTAKVKGRFEIPKGKTLIIAGNKMLSKTKKIYRKKSGLPDAIFKDDGYRSKAVEVMLILIKPRVLEPAKPEEKAIPELVE